MKDFVNIWFDIKANMYEDYSFLKDNITLIKNIEIIPLLITGNNPKSADYEMYPNDPNAYGVYLRYNEEAINNFNLNPSEWIADFETEKPAIAFKQLLLILINKI